MTLRVPNPPDGYAFCSHWHCFAVIMATGVERITLCGPCEEDDNSPFVVKCSACDNDSYSCSLAAAKQQQQ